MADFITTFESGELEIALVTYNRCDFVKEWLERCYEQIKIRNIHLSVYDSSICDDTETYIKEFKNEKNDMELEYHHVDSNINIGYKPMLPILNSKSKYVWVSGDSRYHDFECLDKKVFPYLKKDIDYVIFHIINNEENDGKIYTNKNELLRECFVSMTCIGLSIYKVSMFDALKYDKFLMDKCNKKYKNNYGFAWIGYFLEIFALGKHKALFSVVSGIDLGVGIKIPTWFKRCYGCWIEDLCTLMDAVAENYQYTEIVMRDTWTYISLDSPGFCDFARRKGDLNVETYRKYKDNGMLDRVTRKAARLERFADAADEDLDKCLAKEAAIEREEFEELCYQCVARIKECSKGKKLWIYGAGKGGKILLDCLKEYNVPVYGFLDKDAETIRECEGILVKSVKNINKEKCYIVISLFNFVPTIMRVLLEYGIK